MYSSRDPIENIHSYFNHFSAYVEDYDLDRMSHILNFNCNAIEGNRATYFETQLILNGVDVPRLTSRDILDIQGYSEAFNFLRARMNRNSQLPPLNEDLIKHVHKLLLVGDHYMSAIHADGTSAGILVKVGEYKSYNNCVTQEDGTLHHFSDYKDVPKLMADFVISYNSYLSKYGSNREFDGTEGKTKVKNLFKILAELHTQFINIHPFADGNGRMCRLLLNFFLNTIRKPLLVISNYSKYNYYKAIKATHADSYATELQSFLAKSYLNSLSMFYGLKHYI